MGGFYSLYPERELFSPLSAMLRNKRLMQLRLKLTTPDTAKTQDKGKLPTVAECFKDGLLNQASLNILSEVTKQGLFHFISVGILPDLGFS